MEQIGSLFIWIFTRLLTRMRQSFVLYVSVFIIDVIVIFFGCVLGACLIGACVHACVERGAIRELGICVDVCVDVRYSRLL